MHVLECVDGPYEGYLFRLIECERIVWIRPRYDFGDQPFKSYMAVERESGDVVLKFWPDPSQ